MVDMLLKYNMNLPPPSQGNQNHATSVFLHIALEKYHKWMPIVLI